MLEKENIEINEENIFIVATCKEKGISFLKGEAKINIRKNDLAASKQNIDENHFTVKVNGNKYFVEVNSGLMIKLKLKI